MQRAVEHGFLTRRAIRLVGAARRVEPHVHAGVQGTRDADVVVLDEHQACAQVRVGAEVDELADQVLAEVVPGMGLAGEHEELHWTVSREQ